MKQRKKILTVRGNVDDASKFGSYFDLIKIKKFSTKEPKDLLVR